MNAEEAHAVYGWEGVTLATREFPKLRWEPVLQ